MPWPHAGFYGTDNLTGPTGVPVRAGTVVHVYEAGTDTLASLWADRDRSVEVANPFATQAGGNLAFYAEPGRYDAEVNGATITLAVTVDPDDLASTVALDELAAAVSGVSGGGGEAAVLAHVAEDDPHGDRAYADGLVIGLAPTSALTAKADLVGGVVPTSQIPAVALVKPTAVANITAMLALDVQAGDIAVVQDTGSGQPGVYMLGEDGDPSVLGDWFYFDVPAGGVLTVNGQAGTVVLVAGDVGAYTEGEVDALLAFKANASALSDYATLSYLSTTLSGYVTSVALASALSGYVTTSDARLTDTRTPTDGSVTDAKITAGGLSPTKVTGTSLVTFAARASSWYGPSGGRAAGAVGASGNRLYLVPILLAPGTTIKGIRVNTSTATANAVVHLGLYTPDSTGWPSALLYDSGAIADATIQVNTHTVTPNAVTSTWPLVWACMVNQTANPNHTAYDSAPAVASLPSGNASTMPYGFILDGVSGSLPANLTGGSTPSPFGAAAMPLIQVQAA